MGLQLLNRSTHGMQLTGDGERCYAFARQVLESCTEMEAELLAPLTIPAAPFAFRCPTPSHQDQLIPPWVNTCVSSQT